MNWEILHHNFINEIREKIPQKTKLAITLAEMLSLEREAIYRRLRGEVPFSFYEVSVITKKLNISIDQMIRIETPCISSYFLKSIDYKRLDETLYKELEDYIDFLKLSGNDPDSEIAEISNTLPVFFWGNYDFLVKYFIFKWSYQYDNTNRSKKFHETEVSDRLRQIYRSYFQEVKNFALTHIIWDNSIFQNIVIDINNFLSIDLITIEDVKNIKKDLLALLDYVESIATEGIFEETNTKVALYISDTFIDTDYTYSKVFDNYISYIRTFILNSVVFTDKRIFDNTKNWIISQKRLSTKMSVSGEKIRTHFFNTQREIVGKL